MIKRILIGLLFIFFTACGQEPGAPSGPTTSASSGSPPIILISIDTLRADRLPVYGYDRVKTPVIDALRADSILYERAWANYPITLPSHATLLTGLLPTEHGIRDNVGYRMSEDLPRLPLALRETRLRHGCRDFGLHFAPRHRHGPRLRLVRRFPRAPRGHGARRQPAFRRRDHRSGDRMDP